MVPVRPFKLLLPRDSSFGAEDVAEPSGSSLALGPQIAIEIIESKNLTRSLIENFVNAHLSPMERQTDSGYK